MTKQPLTDGADVEYSIGVTARLTGVSADKLRVWERRYGFPVPQRGASGARVYTAADLGRLAQIQRALEAGVRAGEATQMSPAELEQLLQRVDARPSEPAAGRPAEVPDLELVIERLRETDVEFVRDALHVASRRLTVGNFCMEFAAPLIERVGLEWERGTLAVRHEHLFSHLMSSRAQQLLAEIEPADGPILLLATLPGEQHGLGLALVSLVAASRGARPVLLGVDTPLDEIVRSANEFRAPAVGLSISLSYDLGQARAAIAELLERLPRCSALWAGGAQAAQLVCDDSRFSVVTSLSLVGVLVDVLREQHERRGPSFSEALPRADLER